MALALRSVAFGPLNTRVVEDTARPGPPALVVVLCHGFGAPGDDLVGLGAELARGIGAAASHVRFVFPEAPIALDNVPFGGRAWWHIDMMALQRALERGEARKMADEVPEGLAPARQKLRACIDAVLKDSGVPMSRLVLGGFSQGAMLSTDVTLHLEEAPAALFVLSGALLNQTEWRRRAPSRRGLRVLQSHGTGDPILPFAGAEALKGVLEGAGLGVDFIQFRGGHTIGAEVMAAATRHLQGLLPG